MDQLMYRDTH